LRAGALEWIPIPRINQCPRGPIRRVRRRVDRLALARFRVPVVERHHRHSEMALWLHALVGRKGTGLHNGWIHAGGLPPETAAPHRRASVGFLVADNRVFRGPANAAPLERFAYRESDPANDDTLGTVWMMAQKIPVITVAHQVAVKGPLPGRPIVQPFPVDGRVVEQVAPAASVRHNGSAPPVVQRQRGVVSIEPLVTVRGKDVVAVICVKLHEQADLAKIAQTRGALSFGLRTSERRQQHRREDRNNGDHHQQLNKREGDRPPRLLASGALSHAEVANKPVHAFVVVHLNDAFRHLSCPVNSTAAHFGFEHRCLEL